MTAMSSEPRTAGDETRYTARPSVLGAIGRATLYGAAWGVAARLWMRYISEDPEFSVAGTSFIIAIPTIISLFSVLATRCVGWRAAARRPSRALAGFSTILLGGAAGILMMPTLVLGGIVWAHRKRLPGAVLIVIATLAAVPIFAVVGEIPKGGRVVVAFPAYLLLLATFIPVYARIYNPARKGTRS